MKPLNKYRVTFARHTYKEIEVEAENLEDAENIAKLKAPKDFEFNYALETPESIINRVFSDETIK